MDNFSEMIQKNLDKYLSICGAIASLILIAYCAVNFPRIIYLVPGILTFLACIVWIHMRGRSSLSFQLKESHQITNIFFILFLVFFTIAILSFRFRPELYERPLLYFVMTAFMAGLISCQILFANEQHKRIILPQIIILGASIAWSQLLLFPNVVGADPWYHQMVTMKIIDFTTIPGGSYSHLPIFHLIIAINSLFTGFEYKIAAMLSVSIAQILCNALFIYLLAILTTKNYKVGLFSALMVIMASHHIFMSYWSIPNGFAAVFIPMALYLIFKNNFKSHLSKTFLILVLLIAIILTHSIASMCMAILLISIWLLSEAYNVIVQIKETTISVILPVFFTLVMFTWWSYASGHIFSLIKLIEWGFSRDVFIMQATADIWTGYIQTIPISEQIFNELGMFLFFALSFIGIFFMISLNNKKAFILAFVALLPLFIGFFSLLGGFSVIEHRWWYFAQILLSVPLGIAIALFFNTFKDHPLKIIGFFICISLFAFTLIMSPAANSDNAIFSKNSSSRSSLTESELFSIESISNKYNGEIGTERYVANVVTYLPIDIDLTHIDGEIYSGDYSKIQQHNILIREYIQENTFKLFQTGYRVDYNMNQQLETQGYDKTYTTSSVEIYSKQ